MLSMNKKIVAFLLLILLVYSISTVNETEGSVRELENKESEEISKAD